MKHTALCAAIATAVFAATVPSPSHAATNITEDVTLTEDTDWTAEGTVTIAEGVTIDLDGHSLTVAGLAGKGRIIDGSEYRRVEYIQATQNGAAQSSEAGDKTQYIDTGYRHNAKTVVDLRVAYTNPGSFQVVYGARNTTDNSTQFGVWLNGSRFMTKTCQGAAATPASGYDVTANRIYDVHISKSGSNTVTSPDDASINYDLAAGNGIDGNNADGNDFLLAINQSNNSSVGSWPCKCKVWFCKIYDNGTLVRNFIPVVRRSNGEAGFYDTETQQFYGKKNAAADALVAGPTISGGLHLAIAPGATYDLSNLTIDAECFSDGGTLTEDIDWRRLGNLIIETGTTLDLAGHSLSVPAISGDGIINDSVCAQLPGYERIEYLQSSGTQFIDTGYVHNKDTKVLIRVAFTKVTGYGGGYCVFYGARAPNNDRRTQLGGWLHNGRFMEACDDSASDTSLSAEAGTIYDVELAKTGSYGLSNLTTGVYTTLGSGNGYATSPYQGNTPQTDYIFALHQDGGTAWYCSMRCYGCKIWNGTALVRDFVPVRRKEDGALGVLDCAGGGFYPNNGSGTFTAGADLATAAGGELRVAVAAGSTATCNVALTGALKLVKEGGGTLVMSKEYLNYMGGTEIADGVLKSGAGLARPCGMAGTAISAAAAGSVDFNGNANMQAYIYDFAEGAKALNTGAGISGGTFSFLGAYTPVATGAYECTLSAGSTLCLADWNGDWPVANVSFPAGSAVRVNLAGRRDRLALANEGTLLLAWGEALDDVTFTLDDDTARRGFIIRTEETGLRFFYAGGTAIIVR